MESVSFFCLLVFDHILGRFQLGQIESVKSPAEV